MHVSYPVMEEQALPLLPKHDPGTFGETIATYCPPCSRLPWIMLAAVVVGLMIDMGRGRYRPFGKVK